MVRVTAGVNGGGWRRALCLVLAAGCGGGGGADWSPAFEPDAWLVNVWGPAEDDLYAVGGEPGDGAVVHFDGDTWEPLDLGIEVELLTWAYGFGPNEITAVGSGGTIIHFDGAAWEQQASPTAEDLWGVWGAAPDDVWAVGGRGRMAGQATLLHFDGDAWSLVELPPLQRAGVNAFFKVWGTSADNVYAVGQRGAVIHYDGAVWSEELVGASDDLVSLWGTGPDLIVAVGGRAAGIVSVWDGEEWETRSLAPLPGLNGVWTDSATEFRVVGTLGTLLTFDPTTFDYVEESAPTADEFHAVFSAAGERAVAVGGNLQALEGPYRGIAFERDLGR